MNVRDGAVSTSRIPKTGWFGFALAVFYVIVAVALGDALGDPVADDDNLSFILGQWVPVGILIIIGLLVVWKAGWTREGWTSPSVFSERRRWWMLAIPVVLALQTLHLLIGVPWSEKSLVTLLVVLLASLLIGLGEELYFRGIFRITLLSHHGEFFALMVTSLAFGVAHAAKFIIEGVPVAAVALNVAFLAMDGALFYGALRATGTLWVPILLHGLGDFARFASQGSEDPTGGAPMAGDFLTAGIEYLLIGLSIALVVSVARNDRRVRREKQAADRA